MKKRDYVKERKHATVALVIGIIWIFVGVVAMLVSGALYLEAMDREIANQSRTEEFNPQAVRNLDNSWKTMRLQALSYEFAEDFKGTYRYYIAFTDYGEIRIVKMKGELAAEYEPYVEYLFSDEDAEVPPPLEIRGIAVEMEDDIKEYAIEALEYMFGEGVVTGESFDMIVGTCFLDLTGKPSGGGLEDARDCLLIFALFAAVGVLILVLSIRRRSAAVLAIEKEKAMFQEVRSYRDWEPGTDGGRPVGAADYSGGQPVTAADYDEFRPRRAETDSLGEIMNGQPSREKGNMALGILGAVGGSLLGVLLWILIGFAGFIAGLAGFAMLKFALMGYQKLSGKLDKKGAVFCLLWAAFMILTANVLDFGIVICRALFEYEASLDTVRYVAMNFFELMDSGELWADFFKNLLIGYGLSIWSSCRLIGAILRFKE